MHVAVAVVVIFSVWIWGDWRHWEKYHTSMLYIAMCNLLYNFLCANHFLWKLNPDILSNHTLTEMLYTFIVFSGSALLFLSRYPDRFSRKVVHYAFWIGIYIIVEWWFGLFEDRKILYQYGWSLGWSALFDLIMFPMLRLHFRKPLIAYILSIGFTTFFLWLFDIPVAVPIEDRKPG